MKLKIVVIILLILVSNTPGKGQIDTLALTGNIADAKSDNFALFGSDDLLEISIRLDLTRYIRKNSNDAGQDAVLVFHLSDTDSIVNNVKAKFRGNFRFDNCWFSPMEVTFKKHIHAYSDTDRIKKIKLVTHCESGTIGDNYVLKEYIVYKLYNVISDTSFRVRLLKINYIDTQNKRKTIVQYGFFIEPDEILGERIKSEQVKTMKLTQRFIRPDIMDKVSIFNYMTANWDWNIPNLQNVVVFKSFFDLSPGSGIAVPYDFDLSGIVSPDYAVLPEEYPLKSSRDRIFLGICRSREVFEKDLFFFLNRKDQLYATINDFPYLNQKAKRDIISLLNTFFNQIDNPGNLEYFIDYLTDSCKKL